MLTIGDHMREKPAARLTQPSFKLPCTQRSQPLSDKQKSTYQPIKTLPDAARKSPAAIPRPRGRASGAATTGTAEPLEPGASAGRATPTAVQRAAWRTAQRYGENPRYGGTPLLPHVHRQGVLPPVYEVLRHVADLAQNWRRLNSSQSNPSCSPSYPLVPSSKYWTGRERLVGPCEKGLESVDVDCRATEHLSLQSECVGAGTRAGGRRERVRTVPARAQITNIGSVEQLLGSQQHAVAPLYHHINTASIQHRFLLRLCRLQQLAHHILNS